MPPTPDQNGAPAGAEAPLHPTIQPEARFACHRCGACCRREPGIELEPEDELRIGQHDWAAEDERFRRGWRLPGTRPGAPSRLRTRGGSCIFLDEDSLCRVHKRLGRQAKPLRCRAFPYRFSTLGPEHRLAVTVACESLHRSFEDGPEVVEESEHVEMVEQLPGLVLVGSKFLLLTDGRELIDRDGALHLLDDLAGVAASDDPLADLPRGVGRPCRRALEEVPPAPWRFEGPPGTSFYAVLKALSEEITPAVQGHGLGLLASGMAELRGWRSWGRVAAGLEPRAVRFVRYTLRSLIFEGRALALGYVVAGAGLCLYLAMAAGAAAWRTGQLMQGGSPGRAQDVNRAATEALRLLTWRQGMEICRGQALAFERLVLDAPASDAV
jgi:Fe-S-cluster containining protein